MSGDCAQCGTEIPDGREWCDPCVDLIGDIVDADMEAFERAYERQRDLLPYKGTLREPVQDSTEVILSGVARRIGFDHTPELVKKVTLRIFKETGIDPTLDMGATTDLRSRLTELDEFWRHVWPVLAETDPHLVHRILQHKTSSNDRPSRPNDAATARWPEFDRLEDVLPDERVPPQLRTLPTPPDATTRGQSTNAAAEAEAPGRDLDTEDCHSKPAQIPAEIERDRAAARPSITRNRRRDVPLGHHSSPPAIDL